MVVDRGHRVAFANMRIPKPPLAVLFDLDGTLIDSIELILTSMHHAFRRHGGAAPSDAEWLEGVGIPLKTMFARYVGANEIDTIIGFYREHQLEHHDRLVSCYADVPATLEQLRDDGHPLAVVTSKSDWLAQRGLEHVGVAQLFDTIVGCDSCSRHKPHPEPVLTALARLGYSADEAVFIGDSVHDIEAGNAAGVTSIAALWGPFSRGQLEPAHPDYCLERISDLPILLTRLRGLQPSPEAGTQVL
jgi:pyrophosphatase PpaX